jgi:hypothetical protein
MTTRRISILGVALGENGTVRERSRRMSFVPDENDLVAGQAEPDRRLIGAHCPRG